MKIGQIDLGELPKVVGVISTRHFLQNLKAPQVHAACDIVELRFDLLDGQIDPQLLADQVASIRKPIIFTIRSHAEGGKWNACEERRLELLQEGAQLFDAVDVEFQSEIAKETAEAARAAGKAWIISFHDFSKTPSTESLFELAEKMQQLGGVTKITTRVENSTDLEALQSLLQIDWDNPVCVMGMGPLGRDSRIEFPLQGSALTYGYMDEPVAPGQWAAQELVQALSARNPAYALAFATG